MDNVQKHNTFVLMYHRHKLLDLISKRRFIFSITLTEVWINSFRVSFTSYLHHKNEMKAELRVHVWLYVKFLERLDGFFWHLVLGLCAKSYQSSVCCLIGVLFEHSDGGSAFLRNVNKIISRLHSTTSQKIVEELCPLWDSSVWIK
jgi:hypothetical protein